MPTTLPRVLAERAAEVPDRTYLRDVEGRRLDYAGVLAESLRWAAAYRRLGVARGDVVVTMQLNTLESFCGWLGLAWLGAVEAPIHVDYRGAILSHVLNTTRASVMVVLERYAERLRDIAGELPHLRTVVVIDAAGELPDLPFRTVGGDAFLVGAEAGPAPRPPAIWDLGAILFTSGTTGPSKAVRVPWGQLHAASLACYPSQDLGPEDVILSPGPVYHTAAKMFPFLAALVGASVLMRPYISQSASVEEHERFGVTTSATSMLQPLVDTWLARPPRADDADCPLRNLIIGPSLVPGLERFKERFGVRTYVAYNMTELSIPLCDEGWDATRHRGWDTLAGRSCGRLRRGYPGYEARVVDEHDQELPPGRVGQLIVRASAPWTTNDGYLGTPEATAAAWRNGWFHTGDAFTRDEDGYFYFVDRMKDAIRRRGENISSLEVEAAVNAHPEVRESAAVAVREDPNPGADEEVLVVVVLRRPGVLKARELIEFLIPRMPRFMVPRYVRFVDELPRTQNNKVRKALLRESAPGPDVFDREAEGMVIPR